MHEYDLDNVAKNQRIRFIPKDDGTVRVLFFAPIYSVAAWDLTRSKAAARKMYASYRRMGFTVAEVEPEEPYFNEDAERERYESDRYALWNPEDPRELGWI